MKKITTILIISITTLQFISAQTVFEPGKISLNGQHDDYICFDPKGNYLLFTRLEADYRKGTIYWCEKKNNAWQQPTVAFFSGKYEDSRPFVSPDGKRIFFASNRPTESNPNKMDLDIWYIEKNGDKWTEPINAGAIINTSQNETHPSVASNGNLYFVKWGGGVPNDIYWSRYEKGIYQTPQPISSINTEKSESHVFISSDESFLFFGKTIDAQGMDGQVFISINRNGQWSQPISFDEVNSNLYEYSAKLSINKKNLFFSRTDFKPNGEAADIYIKEVNWDKVYNKYKMIAASDSTAYNRNDFSFFKNFIGDWHGTNKTKTVSFYESYHFKNDTLLEMKLYDADPTFKKISDKSSVYLEKGNIIH